jgi:hypothetical protein
MINGVPCRNEDYEGHNDESDVMLHGKIEIFGDKLFVFF